MTRIFVALLLTLTACGDGGDSTPDATTSRPDAVPPLRTCTPTEVEQEIFEVWCTGRCHAGAQPDADLDLTPGALERMAGAPAAFCGSGSLTLVVPGDPAQSYLVEKVLRNPRCGAQMPLSSELIPEDLACLESAIAAMQ
jgi:hypothetical protein